MSFGMSQLIGIYATLGPGSYLKRLSVTHLCGGAFLLSVFGGFSTAGGDLPGGDFKTTFLCFAAIASSTPQLVFGCFRLFRGWRLHKSDHDRGPAYDLKDMFTLTLYVSCVLTPLSFQLRNSVGVEGIAVTLLSVILLTGTLLYGAPTLLASFRVKDTDQGCGVQFIILATFSFTIIMPLLTIGAHIVVVPLLILLFGSALFTWLPLAFMREKGFVLSNGKEN